MATTEANGEERSGRQLVAVKLAGVLLHTFRDDRFHRPSLSLKQVVKTVTGRLSGQARETIERGNDLREVDQEPK